MIYSNYSDTLFRPSRGNNLSTYSNPPLQLKGSLQRVANTWKRMGHAQPSWLLMFKSKIPDFGTCTH